MTLWQRQKTDPANTYPVSCTVARTPWRATTFPTPPPTTATVTIAVAKGRRRTLTVESSPSVVPDKTVHRFYVNTTDASDRVSAVFGNNEKELRVDAPAGVFNSTFNNSWNPSGSIQPCLGSIPNWPTTPTPP